MRSRPVVSIGVETCPAIDRPVTMHAVLLHELVATSAAVAKASSRLAKIAELAALFQRVTLPEVDVAVAFLSGEPRQGRIGIGASAIRVAKTLDAAPSTALSP